MSANASHPGSDLPTLGQALAILLGARRLVALTGAGCSAGSGIPTYRGEGGLWTEYDPEKYASIAYFEKDPAYYFRFFRDVRYPVLAAARPNEAHRALARLQRAGRLHALVTQNIDGLHQEAGSTDVLELHGNTRRFRCLGCGALVDFAAVHRLLAEALPPPCPHCQGALRPDVVLFGERLPEDVLQRSLQAAREADVMLVVGSSLVVQPAASLPVINLERGGRLVIVNLGDTPLDRVATVKVDADAVAVLPHLVEALAPS